MKIVKMKISELKCPEQNIRIHTEKQIQEFERSVKMFGQIRPIVVDDDNVILCGNGLYATLVKMGIDTADVYKVTGLTENQKKKLMIADNKIYGLGIDDLDTFNKFLSDLGEDLDIPGFDESILKSMVAEAEDVTEKISEYGTIDDEEIKAIQASKERKEALMANPPSNEPEEDQTDDDAISNDNSPHQTTPPEPTETQKSVICPECGCRIWL
ncbi:MAG: hypothetical protein IJC04_00325 [Oscillospiraceae bacterium]|nr:hypothetical protein [Oscillospiraceae bacterium]